MLLFFWSLGFHLQLRFINLRRSKLELEWFANQILIRTKAQVIDEGVALQLGLLHIYLEGELNFLSNLDFSAYIYLLNNVEVWLGSLKFQIGIRRPCFHTIIFQNDLLINSIIPSVQYEIIRKSHAHHIIVEHCLVDEYLQL